MNREYLTIEQQNQLRTVATMDAIRAGAQRPPITDVPAETRRTPESDPGRVVRTPEQSPANPSRTREGVATDAAKGRKVLSMLEGEGGR